jgi:5'/3'-nucleotidase SurE
MPAAGSLATLAGLAALCGTGPLDILLTNDDGVDAVGVRTLRAQLQAAGHRVVLAAPDRNASGSGMSFTWGNVRVVRDPQDAAVYAIGGSPATTVVLAATALYPAGRRPDLVISGINHGPNAGSLLMLSGTVGAALAGTLLLDPPVPGLAVNAERLRGDEPVDSPANRAQYEAVGAHLARIVAATRGWFCDDGEVAHPRTVLNVNYPARPVADLRGVVVAGQGSETDLRLTFTQTAVGQFQAQASQLETVDARESDNQRLEDGYVTVTPLNGRLGDDAPSHRKLERRLRAL